MEDSKLAQELRAIAEEMVADQKERDREMLAALMANTHAVEQLAQEMRNKNPRRAASGSTKVRRTPTRKVEVSPKAEAAAKATFARIRARH